MKKVQNFLARLVFAIVITSTIIGETPILTTVPAQAQALNQPAIVGTVLGPNGTSVIEAYSNGMVAYNGNPNYGNLLELNLHLKAPITGIAETDGGIVLVGADGGVFALHTPYYGSIAGNALTKVVGIADEYSGYFLLEQNGAVETLGKLPLLDNPYYRHIDSPAVAIQGLPTKQTGYAVFYANGTVVEVGIGWNSIYKNPYPLTSPIVGGLFDPYTPNKGYGYWEVASDGGVYCFDEAPFVGTATSQLSSPVVGMTLIYNNGNVGYDLTTASGQQVPYIK